MFSSPALLNNLQSVYGNIPWHHGWYFAVRPSRSLFHSRKQGNEAIFQFLEYCEAAGNHIVFLYAGNPNLRCAEAPVCLE